MIPTSEIKPNFENCKIKLRKIYQKIPIKELKKRPEIEKLVFPEPVVIYRGISKNKYSEKMKIPKDLTDDNQKKINSLNEFKEILFQFNKNEKADEKNKEIKKENNKFSKDYDQLIKEKNKFSTGTYMDYDYLIKIANHYAEKGIKVPKISRDKNIFKANPLILSGNELEYYFLYNLGDKKKSSIYLNKADEITTRKLTGNYRLSDEETRHLEFLQKNEKPKGFVPLNILIPKLKQDIINTQNTIDNIAKDNYEENQNIKSRNKIDNKENKENKDNIYVYSTNMTNSSKKVLKKSLSLANYNIYSSRINSSVSTKENKSKGFSLLNPKIFLPNIERDSKSNIASAISRDNKMIKLTKFKLGKKNILGYVKQKLINNDRLRDILSGYDRVSNTIDSEKDNFNINLIPNKKRILKRSLKSLNSVNSLTSIRTNSLMSAFSKKSNLNNQNENPIANNIDNNNLMKNLFDKDKESERKEDNKENGYKKCESIFESILEGKYKSRRSKSELNDFLKKRGYNPEQKFDDKDNVLNLSRIKNKSIDRNYILEEFKIRNAHDGKYNLSEEQQKIIKKHENIIKRIESNDYILKKIICEKPIDKDSYNS